MSEMCNRFFLAFLSFLQLICTLNGSRPYYDLDAINFSADSNPKYIDLDCRLVRAKVDNRSMNVVVGHLTIIKTILCEFTSEVQYIVKVNGVYQEPLLKAQYTIDEIFNSLGDTTIGASASNIQKCMIPNMKCPLMAGDKHELINCRMGSAFSTVVTSKYWNISFETRDNISKEKVFSFWVELEFNDVNIARSKRPTVSQKARRKGSSF